MKEDKTKLKHARTTFQSSLKASRIHYRREKKDLQKTLPKRRFLMRRAEKEERREKKKVLSQAFQEEKEATTETFQEAIRYVSPQFLKVREMRKYRLPQARQRLAVARKHLAEVKLEEKKIINPKFAYHQNQEVPATSRFQFKREKTLKRLETEKELTSAKHEIKHLKTAYKAKKVSTKVKRGLGFIALEAVRGDLYDNSIPGGGDGMGYAYGQCTWGVAARINQLGLKLKGRNGEKIPIINTMGNGQDWVRTAASLGGETGAIPKAGAILSFSGGSHGSDAAYGHVAFLEKVYPDGSFLISETNVNGNPNYTFRRISGVDSTLSFAYTTK
ncbi:CHAP domain-containing protein [Streptococcus sp. ZJ93]